MWSLRPRPRRNLRAARRLRSRRSHRGRSPGDTAGRTRTGPELAELEHFAASIANELANLTSGIEGHAQLVLEAAGTPGLAPSVSERLWKALRRLRRFNHKLLSFSRAANLVVGPTDVTGVLDGVRSELEDLDTGLKVGIHTAPTLPMALTAKEALHEALVFLAEAILRLEHFASRISFYAYTRLQDDHDPVVEIEVQVDLDEEAPPSEGRSSPDPTLLLDYVAARNLLDGQGAHMSLSHVSGITANVLVTLPATTRAVPTAEAPPLPLPPRTAHEFGGVLLLEDDPSIRAMVSAELKSTGRNVFACSDGAAAHSLLAATPERFELLILDQTSRLDSWDRLASTAMALCPGVKVCLLTHREDGEGVPEHLAGRVQRIPKPFGLNELRDTLRGLLDK